MSGWESNESIAICFCVFVLWSLLDEMIHDMRLSMLYTAFVGVLYTVCPSFLLSAVLLIANLDQSYFPLEEQQASAASPKFGETFTVGQMHDLTGGLNFLDEFDFFMPNGLKLSGKFTLTFSSKLHFRTTLPQSYYTQQETTR